MVSPIDQVRITSAICSAAAILSTLYRLYTRRNRLWADDGWAMVSMLALMVQVTAVFLPVTGSIHRIGVKRYYLMAVSFYAIIWSARLSILLSIIRIDVHILRRRIMFGIALGYFIIFLLLVSQLFWVCEPLPHWKDTKIPQCKLPKQVAIFQLVSDTMADLILLIAPLQLFLILRDRWLRDRLMIIFSTCIITTIVSLVHAVYIFLSAGTKVVIAGLVEDCVSLIVCNIPVIVTACLKLGDHASSHQDPIHFLPSFMVLKSLRAMTVDMNHGSTTLDVGVMTVISKDDSERAVLPFPIATSTNSSASGSVREV